VPQFNPTVVGYTDDLPILNKRRCTLGKAARVSKQFLDTLASF
jgi:hypothetical protein